MISDAELVDQVRKRFNEKFRVGDTPFLQHAFPPLVSKLADTLLYLIACSRLRDRYG